MGGDMMWEIEEKYMREVNKAGAMRADHQLQALWEKLMKQYREEIERLCLENNSAADKKKMIALLDKCKRKKEAEYFEQEEEEAPEEENQEEENKEEEHHEEGCQECTKKQEKIDGIQKEIDELKKKIVSAKVSVKGGGGRTGGRLKTPLLVQESSTTVISIPTVALIGLVTGSRASIAFVRVGHTGT